MEYTQEIVKEVNGHKYTFTITYNEIIARQIDYTGMDYCLTHKTNCYVSEIIKRVQNEEKNIGKLIFNDKTKLLSLHKFINSDSHKMQTTSEYGVNEKIFKNLRVCDKIIFHVGQEVYKISVAKALKVGNYKHFKNSYNSDDLQFFIPTSELKCISVKNCKNKNTKKIK